VFRQSFTDLGVSTDKSWFDHETFEKALRATPGINPLAFEAFDEKVASALGWVDKSQQVRLLHLGLHCGWVCRLETAVATSNSPVRHLTSLPCDNEVQKLQHAVISSHVIPFVFSPCTSIVARVCWLFLVRGTCWVCSGV